jgi:hypothetical protein
MKLCVSIHNVHSIPVFDSQVVNPFKLFSIMGYKCAFVRNLSSVLKLSYSRRVEVVR